MLLECCRAKLCPKRRNAVCTRNMLEGEGQLSYVSCHGNVISPSPAGFDVKRKHTGGNEAKKSKKSLKFAGTTCVSEEPSVSLNSSCVEETSQNHENSGNADIRAFCGNS